MIRGILIKYPGRVFYTVYRMIPGRTVPPDTVYCIPGYSTWVQLLQYYYDWRESTVYGIRTRYHTVSTYA